MFSVYTANQGPVINCPWNENDPMAEPLLQLSAGGHYRDILVQSPP